jgi:hypothetical protein
MRVCVIKCESTLNLPQMFKLHAEIQIWDLPPHKRGRADHLINTLEICDSACMRVCVIVCILSLLTIWYFTNPVTLQVGSLGS